MSICCLSNAHRGKLMVNLDFSELVSNLLVVLRASNYENEKNELIFEYDYNENLEKKICNGNSIINRK